MGRKISRTSRVLCAVSLVLCIVGIILISPIGTSASEISNEYLLLDVQDNTEDTSYANFILKKAEFGVTNDTLTYSQFYSAYTTVSINGEIYKYSDGEVLKPLYKANDGSVITVMNFNGLEITQRLVFSTGNSSKEDMLLIHYSAENKTDSDLLLSIRIIIDPTLSNSETDLIQTDERAFETEGTITGAEIPNTWFIKDADGFITAYGMLATDYTIPDEFQAANWKNLRDSRYGYITNNQTAITDNAVAISWNNKTIVKNDTLQVATKYGLYSEDEIITTQPVTEPTEPETVPTEPTEPETVPTEPTEPETVPTEPTEPETVPTKPTKPTESATKSTEAFTSNFTDPATNATVIKPFEGTNAATSIGATEIQNSNQSASIVLTGENSRMILGWIFFIAAGVCLAVAVYNFKRKGVDCNE